ncbi:MAG: hypothetical protein ACRD4S_08565 [Candidatus Acidiferrales bacterium]
MSVDEGGTAGCGKGIVIPTFKYGDACESGDDKYVVAQFRSDALLSRVPDLRSFLHLSELKYRDFHPRRHQVMSNAEMWAKFEKGIQQAEITIVDPHVYKQAVIDDWLDQKAEPGIDFDLQMVNDQSGEWMIQMSPLGIAESTSVDYYFEHVAFDEATGRFSPDAEFQDFSAPAIKRRAGGRLKDATVLAARSHAMLSPSERREVVAICNRSSSTNYGTRCALLAKMCRVFDVDHPGSVPILNEFSERLIHAAGIGNVASLLRGSAKMVSEEKSQSIDHIQAADMAAGWAVDLLIFNRGDYKELAKRFAWVGVNGVIVPE